MKVTLAFDIFNKAEWLESLMESWLRTLSGRHTYETIVVLDACHDASQEIAECVLGRYSYPHKLLTADNEYEIFCNDLALQYSTGEVIVFIQDDNWMYDHGWDDLLVRSISRAEAKHGTRVGAIGLLAGANFTAATKWDRVACNRMHIDGNYNLGVWQVNTICRPFAIRTELLRRIGGFDFAYRPTMFDDMDICLRLAAAGYQNIYIPFDIVNTVASTKTMGEIMIKRMWNENFRVCREKNEHTMYRLSQQAPKLLFPLRETSGGLEF